MQIFSHLFDLVLAPRPTQKLLRKIDSLPTKTGYSRNGVFYLSSYSKPVISAAVTENKYHTNHQATQLLTSLIENSLTIENGKIIFIPVPLSKKRERERGYNQVTKVLRKINRTDVFVLEDVLHRTKDCTPQTQLTKSERLQNIRNVFAIENVSKLKNLSKVTIYLVDDVVTTGATMEEARATLAPHILPTCQLKTLAFAH